MYGFLCVLAVILYAGLLHSWEFALSSKNKIFFYDFNGKELFTVNISSENPHAVALTYDEVNNVLLYIDKRRKNNDTICGLDLSLMTTKCFIKRNGRNIRSIAFDPATERLFFSDTIKRSINWISVKPGHENPDYGQHLITLDKKDIPTDITIDSCRGLVYWMKKSLMTYTIERAQFDGSKRKVLNVTMKSLEFNKTVIIEPNSLTIDLQVQRMYWIQPNNVSRDEVYYTDLDATQPRKLYFILVVPRLMKGHIVNPLSSLLTVTNDSLFYTGQIVVKKYGKLVFKVLGSFDIVKPGHLGLATKYRIEDRILGNKNCKPLSNLDLKCEKPFCVHGVKVYGKPQCTCKLGYIGQRCDVSACQNYCFNNATCTLNAQGKPNCSCTTGFSGKRCFSTSCVLYCLNNGTCSINKENKPVCKCKSSYSGTKCEYGKCHNYCIFGNCSYNKTGSPQCSCQAAYTGPRCYTKKCYNYCLNSGVCSLDKKNNAICTCKNDYSGNRCQTLSCTNYCKKGTCTYDQKGAPQCSCPKGYKGKKCDVKTLFSTWWEQYL